MRDLLQLALLVAQAALPAPGAPPDRRQPWCLAAVASGIALCLIVAAGFLLAAAFLWLLPIMGATRAALVIGLAALFVAAGLVLLIRRRPIAAAPPPAAPALHGLIAEAERIFKANTTASVLAALLAGVVAGSTDTKRP